MRAIAARHANHLVQRTVQLENVPVAFRASLDRRSRHVLERRRHLRSRGVVQSVDVLRDDWPHNGAVHGEVGERCVRERRRPCGNERPAGVAARPVPRSHCVRFHKILVRHWLPTAHTVCASRAAVVGNATLRRHACPAYDEALSACLSHHLCDAINFVVSCGHGVRHSPRQGGARR